jgi:hypothetical protein
MEEVGPKSEPKALQVPMRQVPTSIKLNLNLDLDKPTRSRLSDHILDKREPKQEPKQESQSLRTLQDVSCERACLLGPVGFH